MAVVHDGTANVAGGEEFEDGVLTLSKTTAGTDRCEIVHIGYQFDTTVSFSVTSNGVAMTQVVKRDELGTGAGDIGAVIFRSANASEPGTAAHDVVITSSDPNIRFAAGVSSYSGVNRSGTFDSNSGTGSGSGPSVTQVTGVTADTMVVDTAFVDNTFTVGADQTQVLNELTTLGGYLSCLGSYQDGNAGGAMTWTGTATWVAVTVNLPAAGGGGGGRTTKNTRSAPLGVEVGINWRV